MRIVYMNGGLGNQIFQYIFFRWLEIETGESCVIDDALFWGEDVPHNGYELERIFGVRKKRLSQLIPADVWREMVKCRKNGTGIAQQFLDAGNNITAVYQKETPNFVFDGETKYVENDPNSVRNVLSDNCYYHGYWLGDFFWMEFPKVILTELVFPEIKGNNNKKIAKMMSAEQHSTVVHIRRGDMVNLGWATSPAWYRVALRKAEETWHPEHYYLFSDDLPWCIENINELGLTGVKNRLIMVEGNTGESSYIDMQLMSLCAHRLIPRSSFSVAANFFCRRSDKMNLTAW